MFALSERQILSKNKRGQRKPRSVRVVKFGNQEQYNEYNKAIIDATVNATAANLGVPVSMILGTGVPASSDDDVKKHMKELYSDLYHSSPKTGTQMIDDLNKLQELDDD